MTENLPDLILTPDEGVTLSKRRLRLIVEATAEISELCCMMRRAAKDIEPEAVRGMCLRLESLADIIVGAANDAESETAELEIDLFGR